MSNQQTTEKVLGLIGWDAGRLNQLVYDCAEKYLTGFMPAYPQIISQLMKNSIFWSWWKRHWGMRDREFMESCEGIDEPVEYRAMLYLQIHDPMTLLSAIYLNGQVLESTYARMIGEVTRAQKVEAAA